MDLIDGYLKKEKFLDASDIDATSQEEKLDVFYSMFVDLDRKYSCAIDDMHQLELEHKEELTQLQAQIFQVKKLTEEREKLTNDYKEENDELKIKLKTLEDELAKSKTQLDTSIQSEDDLSEATIEMLIYEGFGKVVEAPNHEKIAVLLHDRCTKVEEINQLKKKLDTLSESAARAETLDFEIDNLKLVNEKVCNELVQLKNQNANLEEINSENEVIINENISLKIELNKLNKELDKFSLKDDETSETIDKLDANKVEIAKLKEDNLNLKMEIDRLYDEISSFETECKELREQNKSLQKEKNGSQQIFEEKNLIEIKTLKQEIDDLNEELDDLIQYKASYESLKIDYDKLNAQVQLNTSQDGQTLRSPSRSNLTPSSSFKASKQPESPSSEQTKSKLELEWIRGENEKLLLDLEKVQEKLDDKIESYNSLKAVLVQKDEQMNAFINKYETDQTNSDDLLNLQKKILDLEHLLSAEKEEKLLELESNEKRQKDLLKRNDSLWSQLTNMEQDYKDTVDIVRQQTERIQELDSQVQAYDENVNALEDQVRGEKSLNENLTLKNDTLTNKLEEALAGSNELNVKLEETTRSFEEKLSNANEEIVLLKSNIESLDDQISEHRATNLSLTQTVESLNKEKSFIIDQNENSHSKVMQDYLTLQEKHTDVSYQFNKMNKDHGEMVTGMQEKEACLAKLQSEKNQLEMDLKKEIRDKHEAIEKISFMEAIGTKNVETINDLSNKMHRLEIQKSKLEIKAKELETMEMKCGKIYDELNDKRDTLSQLLEKNGRLEGEISQLETKLSDAKHSLIQSEAFVTELNQLKVSTAQKTEANITLKHDFENEKIRREKTEKKLEEFKEEFKRVKQRMTKIMEENVLLKNESIEIKNQLDGFKAKINLIEDKSHTELEKNSALQDELSEVKKKLELADVKCANYSDKFDMLLKKYESRKIRQKNKIERLWEYLQRERVKYKNLLANAQCDLSTTKSILDKGNESKNKNEITNQQLSEDNSRLVATVADKETKMREIKRQNLTLQSKIKLLEEEMESLHERIDLTAKERNKYRKELQLNLLMPASEFFTSSLTGSYSPQRDEKSISTLSNRSRGLPIDQLERSLKSNSMISSTKYWNELNNNNSQNITNWDVNYNTGYLNRYSGFLESKPSFDLGSTANSIMMMNAKNNNSANKLLSNNGSVATDLNSSPSTPRSFK